MNTTSGIRGKVNRLQILFTIIVALPVGHLQWARASHLWGTYPEDTAIAQDGREILQWISQHEIPIRTIEPGSPTDDLQPLAKIIGNARIIGLGESTHGSHEFFRIKHRLLEFLVSRLGFTTFALEASMPECFDINRFVLNGEGDPEKALAGLYFWTWDTKEFLDLILWMRDYNADSSQPKKGYFLRL